FLLDIPIFMNQLTAMPLRIAHTGALICRKDTLDRATTKAVSALMACPLSANASFRFDRSTPMSANAPSMANSAGGKDLMKGTTFQARTPKASVTTLETRDAM